MEPYQEEGVFMQASSWLVAARSQLQDFALLVLAEYNRCGFSYTIKSSGDTFWVMYQCYDNLEKSQS
jgi:hypothetical protein